MGDLFNTLNKSLPGRSSMPLEGQFFCCASSLSVLAIALYKNFPQNVFRTHRHCLYSQLRCIKTFRKMSFWSPRKRRHGPCMYVCSDSRPERHFRHKPRFWCVLIRARPMYRHTDIYRPICRCIVSAKFRRYISEIFAHKSVALLLCVERSETQVATSSLTLID